MVVLFRALFPGSSTARFCMLTLGSTAVCSSRFVIKFFRAVIVRDQRRSETDALRRPHCR